MNRGSTRMNADREVRALDSPLLHRHVTDAVLGVFFDVYNELGGGFLESVYREGLAIGLAQARIPFDREAGLAVRFRGRPVGVFRPDFVVADAVIVECKAVKVLDEVHHAQLLNYLRAATIEVGILLNFGPTPSFKRLVLENSHKGRSLPR